MKIGAFVASLVFLSCFDVNKSKKHHTLLQQLVQPPQWSDIPAIKWPVPAPPIDDDKG